MRYAIHIVRPPNYAHSGAFVDVADSIVHALRRLGHDAQLCAPVSDRWTIVLGANLLRVAPIDLTPDTILYNLEQVAAHSRWTDAAFMALLKSAVVWDYSKANVAALGKLGIAARFVPIGYDPILTRIEPAEETIDVLFYGVINDRRRAILKRLAGHGVRVSAAFGLYGAERDRVIARSKVVLNLHCFEGGIFEIVRVSYLLANRKPVVSELGSDPAIEAPYRDGVLFADLDGLIESCLTLLRDSDARARLGRAGFEAFRKRPMSGSLEPAVSEP